MLVRRVVIRSDTRAALLEAALSEKNPLRLNDTEREVSKGVSFYRIDRPLCLRANVLGLEIDFYFLYDDPGLALDRSICGEVLVAMGKYIIGHNIIYAGEVRVGVESVVAEVLADFILFGIGRLLPGLAEAAGEVLEREDFVYIDEDVDPDLYLVVKSSLSDSTVRRSGLDRLDLEKVCKTYPLYEDTLKEDSFQLNTIQMGDASLEILFKGA